MKLVFRHVSLLAVSCVVLTAAPAAARELSRTQVAGLAAARANAFVNLAGQVYGIRSRSGKSIGALVARDPKLRGKLDAALQAAPMIDGPEISSGGLVRVAVELDVSTLPRSIRSKIPGLPKMIQADGIADVKSAFLAIGAGVGDCSDEVKLWAVKSLEAEGEANVPARANQGAATAAARNMATAAAYAALTKEVFALPLDAGVTIEAFLEKHPRLRRDVDAAIAGAALASESVDREGTVYKVKISLPGKALLPSLKLGRFRTDPETVLTGEAAELARMNAYDSARDNLKRRIHNLKLRVGGKAEKLIAKDARLKAQIARLCRTRPINRFELTANGMARIYISVRTRDLPPKLRDRLLTGTAKQLDAVGGGLPVKRREPKKDKPKARPGVDEPDVKPEAKPDKPEAKAPAAGKGA